MREAQATRLPLWGRDQNPTASACSRTEKATRLPLWGRDQNPTKPTVDSQSRLPDCPCGGEIKTREARSTSWDPCYQTAPVGARSKRTSVSEGWRRVATRLPLWGRDQNWMRLIKSLRPRLPDCPCGGEIKTRSTTRIRRRWSYQTAPVGARSKRPGSSAIAQHRATRLPLWGRDQNFAAVRPEREGGCGGAEDLWHRGWRTSMARRQ